MNIIPGEYQCVARRPHGARLSPRGACHRNLNQYVHKLGHYRMRPVERCHFHLIWMARRPVDRNRMGVRHPGGHHSRVVAEEGSSQSQMKRFVGSGL